MNLKLEVPVQSNFSEEVAEWIEAFDDLVVAEGHEQGGGASCGTEGAGA